MKYLIGFLAGVIFTTIVFLALPQHEEEAPVIPEAPPAASVESPSTPSEDFTTFYNRFHSDSIYQLTHILFPLEGIPPTADSLTLASGDFRWEKADWALHRPFDAMGGEFVREMRRISDEMVIEDIQHQSGKYGMQRRFARFEDGWYLIYYAGMNQLAAEEAEE